MVSASGTFLGCFLTGVSFYLKAQGLFPEWVPTLALSGILVYIGAFSIGMGPVPWIVMSEIFSINMKAIGGSLVTLVSWLGSFAISYSFSFLMDWSSAGNAPGVLVLRINGGLPRLVFLNSYLNCKFNFSQL
ncbi:sugar transporter ERD6-like 16 [Miscanthus floridulus]|uniref:sugar transporter ERD6-like 16 n=1 Tax=Miscanthus floridulus TaxID=154761 RepID=UPI0034586D9D